MSAAVRATSIGSAPKLSIAFGETRREPRAFHFIDTQFIASANDTVCTFEAPSE
jgi:hypothetical protein